MAYIRREIYSNCTKKKIRENSNIGFCYKTILITNLYRFPMSVVTSSILKPALSR